MDSNGVSQIIAALGVIHNPASTNAQRLQAQEFLNVVEQEPESPFWGYQLSLPENNFSTNNTSNTTAIVRHFGLTLLQRSIKHDYDAYDMQKALAVRKWIVELCTKTTPSDPVFIKEKLASIWVDIAKRIWGSYLELTAEKDPTLVTTANNKEHSSGNSNNNSTDSQSNNFNSKNGASLTTTPEDKNGNLDDASLEEARLAGWISMDRDLFELWEKNLATRELCLIIFRTLFEDVYILDDPLATKRSSILTLLCTEVLTPHDILSKYYNRNDDLYKSRASDEGWVLKWSEFLGQCLENGCQDKESANFAIRLLSTLKTCFHWILPEVLRSADILTKLSLTLLVNEVKVKILTIDCLHALFTRQYGREDDFVAIVGAVFQTGGINMLLTVYRSIKIDPDDINAEEYSLLKKLVEMGVGLSAYLNPVSSNPKNTVNPFPLPKDSDIISYLKFILETTCNESLIVSGLSLSFWVTVLRMDELSHEESDFFKVLPDLLEVVANRLINYELLDEDHVSQKYLEVDFDAQPESVAFLNSYKRYLIDIIRIAICKLPRDGLLWLENRLSVFFSSEMGNKVLVGKKFKYNNGADEAYLLGLSQFAIIEACIKGVTRWKIWYTEESDKDAKYQELNNLVENLFQQLVQVQVNDPMLIKKQIQTLVQFCPLIRNNSNLIFSLLEKILSNSTYDFPPDASDDDLEIIRDLRSNCGTELNRLAYMAPEILGERFDELESAINGVINSDKVSLHESVAFKSFLLVVSQRTPSSADQRQQRFMAIVDPDLSAWSDPATIKGLSNLHWFMERLGIVKIANYFKNRGITAETNLLETEMDEEGKRLKTELKNHWVSVVPTRATRIYLQYSIEKLPQDSPEFKELLSLWKPRIVPILPNILQLLSQIRAYHNPNKWVDLPREVQAFVKYSCTERFWQMGVSTQTRDNFVEESVKATHTLRDFADSVGHIVRYTREYTFLIVGSISSLSETLYEIPEMPGLLWDAVAGDITGVSLHAWKHMIHVLLRPVVKNCPVDYIDTFLRVLLTRCLPTIDTLLVTRWEKVIANGLQLTDGNGIDDDMFANNNSNADHFSNGGSKKNSKDDELFDEMMEEHLLRQLTAVVVRFLIDLVGQFTIKGNTSSSSANGISSSGNIVGNYSESQVKTREMLCSDLSLLENFLKLLVHIISFKDTKCVYNSVLILRGLLRHILLEDDSIDQWLCTNLFPVLIGIILDPYFQDTHSEAGYLLCEIYITIRTKISAPRLLLQKFSGVNDKAMANMERMLISSKSLRQQKNCIVQLITSKQNEQFHEDQRKRTINRLKKKQETDLINQSLMEEENGEGLLNNLFG